MAWQLYYRPTVPSSPIIAAPKCRRVPWPRMPQGTAAANAAGYRGRPICLTRRFNGIESAGTGDITVSGKPRVLVGISMHKAAAARLEEAAIVRFVQPGSGELRESLDGWDGLIVYSPAMAVSELAGAKTLKVISCHACPGDLLDACSLNHIQVTVVPSLWDTVADMTIALMYAAARCVPQADRAMRSGVKGDAAGDPRDLKVLFSGHDIFGRTQGILGLGRIGKILATRVQSLGMKVIYADLVRDSALEAELDLQYASLASLLAESDYLAVLVPLNERTRGMLSEAEFRLMKRDAILVNTARGAIIDEKALYSALSEKRIAAAGLDVFSVEPVTPGNPLLSLDNVICTPHLGGSTKECDMALVDDAVRVLRREAPLFPINNVPGR